MQILTCRCGIAHVELHGLARTKDIADGNRPAARIGTEKRADEKIAATELVFVFVNYASHQQCCAGKVLVFRGEVRDRFADRFQGWTAAEFVDHLLLTTRDDKGVGNRFTALRHLCTYRAIARECHPNGPMHHLTVEKQGTTALRAATTRQSA